MTQVIRDRAGAGEVEPGEMELGEVWTRLQLVEHRLRRALAARHAEDPELDDPYRGLYLTPEAVQRILDTRSPSSTSGVSYGPAPSQDTRLGQLVTRFGLIPLDIELLVIAMAPDIDARFERLYGYLNDDVTQRRPTVGLALELCGMPAAGYGRFRCGQAAPLVAGGLVEVCEPERPLLSRSLR
ncbi:MAG: ATP-binding protein, partial [Sciscionella sp.]